MAEGKQQLIDDLSYENIVSRGGRGFLARLAQNDSFDTVRYREDFLGDVIPDEIDGINNGSGSAAPALVEGAANGQILLDPGALDESYSGLTLGLTATAEAWPIFTARIKITDADYTGLKWEAGWTDALADAGAVNVLATPTYTAADAALFIQDTDDGGNGLVQFVAVDSGTGITKVEPAALILHETDGTQAPSTGVWFTVQVALAPDGSARGKFAAADGKFHYDTGWQASAITPTVAVTPWLFVQNRAADQVTMHVDFIDVRWSRYVA